jgi:hypothetical protein
MYEWFQVAMSGISAVFKRTDTMMPAFNGDFFFR